MMTENCFCSIFIDLRFSFSAIFLLSFDFVSSHQSRPMKSGIKYFLKNLRRASFQIMFTEKMSNLLQRDSISDRQN